MLIFWRLGMCYHRYYKHNYIWINIFFARYKLWGSGLWESTEECFVFVLPLLQPKFSSKKHCYCNWFFSYLKRDYMGLYEWTLERFAMFWFCTKVYFIQSSPPHPSPDTFSPVTTFGRKKINDLASSWRILFYLKHLADITYAESKVL